MKNRNKLNKNPFSLHLNAHISKWDFILFPLSSQPLLFSHWWNFVSHGSNSIIPYWLWEASHLHIFLYKGEPSPHFIDPLLCYCYAVGLESDFWRRSLSIKYFCGELPSSCLLLSCIHGFHHHASSLDFHISLDSYFLSQINIWYLFSFID